MLIVTRYPEMREFETVASKLSANKYRRLYRQKTFLSVSIAYPYPTFPFYQQAINQGNGLRFHMEWTTEVIPTAN